MMRHSIIRTAALVACTVVAGALLVVPMASAQTATPLSVEQPIVCGTSLFGRITGGVAPYTVSYRLQGIVDLTLPPFVVAAAGPFQSPGGYMNAVPYGTYMISVTAADSGGQQATAAFGGIVSDTCGATAAGSSASAASTGGAVSAPAGAASLFVVPSPVAAPGALATLATPDQPFLAQATPVPPGAAMPEAAPAGASPAQAASPTATLAATGSKADVPMMIGSVLVAAGAAFVANEKRRHRWS